MKYKLLMIALALAFHSCQQPEAGQPEPTNNDNEVADPPGADSNPAKARKDGLIGEWKQSFSSMDRNADGELQESEKVPAPYRMGFNYFEFDENGECRRDSDLKLPGTYEVKQESDYQRLYIYNANSMMSETYAYRIYSLSEKELILFHSGVFLIFSRV